MRTLDVDRIVLIVGVLHQILLIGVHHMHLHGRTHADIYSIYLSQMGTLTWADRLSHLNILLLHVWLLRATTILVVVTLRRPTHGSTYHLCGLVVVVLLLIIHGHHF